MSKESAIALGAGVAAAALVLVTAGGALGVYAGLAASVAFSAASLGASYLLRSKQDSAKDAAAQQLNIATAGSAYVVPVVFGTQRMAGNFLRYEEDSFHSEAIEEEVETGGKGGGGSETQVTGYKYYLSWEYGLCMGPVDGFWQILSDPGQKKLLDNDGDMYAFGGANDIEVDADQLGEDEGGMIKIYKGSENQNREADEFDYHDDGMNYRHVCWAMFDDYHMGPNPAPNSYLFEITRWPVCRDENFDVISGLKTQGSNDTGRLEYYDANPAAILYEVLTNKVWGRGMDPSMIDIQSFKDASDFFADNNLGMSLTISEQQSISDIVESIRLHVDTILVWNGSEVRCRVLMDPDTAYGDIIKVDANAIRDLELTRPAWPDVENEVRFEFVSREDNYQEQNVVMQNLGAIAASGEIKSRKIGLRGFSTWEAADHAARRILNDISYPAATIRFKIDRYGSIIECGDIIRLEWSEWSDGTVTSFWRVSHVSDAQQDEQGIEITALEEVEMPAQESVPTTIEQPVKAWQQATPIAKGEVTLAPPKGQAPLLDLIPSSVYEMPPLLTQGESNQLLFLCQRKTTAQQSAAIYWSRGGANDFKGLANKPCWAITGTLVGAMTTEYRDINRDATGIVIQLNQDTFDGPTLLGSANKVQATTDHMDVLIAKPQDLLVIDREVFQIGQATSLGGGQYRLTNYIRARYDTAQASHSNGATVAFIPTLSPTSYIAEQGQVPNYEAIDFRAYPVGLRGMGGTFASFTGPESGGVLWGRGVRPEAPVPISRTVVGSDWVLKFRPKIPWIGDLPFEEEMERVVSSLGTMGFGYRWQSVSSGTYYIDFTVIDDWTYQPDDGTPEGGIVTATVPYPGGFPTTYRTKVWAIWNGLLSPDVANFLAMPD